MQCGRFVLTGDIGRVQVLTDGVRVRQIITNGLTNAIKYAAPSVHGPIRVLCAVTSQHGLHVAAPPSRDGGNQMSAGAAGASSASRALTIEVLDSGPGLRGQSESTLFADFAATVPETRTGAVGSSGLGLAICNRMARLLGGELHLSDRVDGVHGTRFKLTLPAAAHEEAAARAAVTPSDVAPHAPPSAPPRELSPQLISVHGDSRLLEARVTPIGVQLGTVSGGHPDGPGPRVSPSGPRVAPAPRGGTAPLPLGLHVLLVDDSVGNRRVGARMLAALGCTCETASDGDEVRVAPCPTLCVFVILVEFWCSIHARANTNTNTNRSTSRNTKHTGQTRKEHDLSVVCGAGTRSSCCGGNRGSRVRRCSDGH